MAGLIQSVFQELTIGYDKLVNGVIHVVSSLTKIFFLKSRLCNYAMSNLYYVPGR